MLPELAADAADEVDWLEGPELAALSASGVPAAAPAEGAGALVFSLLALARAAMALASCKR